MPIRPTMNRSLRVIRCCRRRYWPERRRSCATWLPMAVTSCNAPAFIIFTIWPRPATSANRAVAVQPLTASTDSRHSGNRIVRLRAPVHCHASVDMCVALAALEAEVHVTGKNGSRVIPFADFHRLPGDTPAVDNTLEPGELIPPSTCPPTVSLATTPT